MAENDKSLFRTEVFLSTDGKHTVVVRGDDAEIAYEEALTVYKKIVAELGTKVKMWGDTMKKDGATPTKSQYKSQAPAKPGGGVVEDANAPFCPVHNRQMKRFTGKFGPFHKCTAKLEDGSWCNEKQNIK